jgi:Zn-dependent peptidase ImmA (M78 family)
MKNKEILTEDEIREIKEMARDARRQFGIAQDASIGAELPQLIEEKGIYICEYPFQSKEESHFDGTITWFKTDEGEMTFIGLNSLIPYDKQIFTLAHEWYHYITHTGKAYTSDAKEDSRTETKADRFAAELLLPADELRRRAEKEFTSGSVDNAGIQRKLRFIARLHGEWWMPYHAIVTRLYEEGLIGNCYDELMKIDGQDEAGEYARIFRTMDPEMSELLLKRTNRISISPSAMEVIVKNYEDGIIEIEEFAKLLALFGKTPFDFGFEEGIPDIDWEDFFAGGDEDEG